MTEDHPLSRYLVPIQRRWPILVGALVLSLVVVWFTLPDSPEPDQRQRDQDPSVYYTATHLLVRERSTAETANFDLVVLLARQGEVQTLVADSLSDEVSPGAVGSVLLEPNKDLGTLGVTATQPTPEQAIALVDTYARVLTEYFDGRAQQSVDDQLDEVRARLETLIIRIGQLEEQIESLSDDSLEQRLLGSELDALIQRYGSLQADLQALESQERDVRPTFRTLQEPVPTAVPGPGAPLFEVPDSPWARFVIAALLSLLAGLSIVFGLDWMDTRLRTRSDTEEAFGLPVLVELPRRLRHVQRKDPLPAASDPSSAIAEGYRSLRLSLTLAPKWNLDRSAPTSSGSVGSAVPVSGRGQPRTILVSSARDGEGKSTVAANLAVSFAETGQHVLVVDCDFRRSTVGDVLQAERGPGLRDFGGSQQAALGELVVQCAHANVSVVRTGTPGVAPSWFPAESGRLLEEAEGLADVVILDTGPLLVTNEAAAMIPTVDAVLLVTFAGRISRPQATRSTELLTQLQATVAGIVLIGSDNARKYGYYYAPLREAAAKGERLEAWNSGRSKTR
jgi:capsular exopolysaccharide synthesis family protein